MVKIDNPPGSPFSLANIPFGVISTTAKPNPRCATAIGPYALDLSSHTEEGHLAGLSSEINFQSIFSQASLNTFAALPQDLRKRVRERIIEDVERDRVSEKSLVRLDECTMHLPMKIGGYSDFYCSLEHMQNVLLPPLIHPQHTLQSISLPRIVYTYGRRRGGIIDPTELVPRSLRLQRPRLQHRPLGHAYPSPQRRFLRSTGWLRTRHRRSTRRQRNVRT